MIDSTVEEQIARWAAIVERSRAFVQEIDRQLNFPGTERVIRLLITLIQQANYTLLVEMQEAGAERPYIVFSSPDVPQDLWDTAATRRLADALRAAGEAAVAVDEERGWTEAGIAAAVSDFASSLR